MVVINIDKVAKLPKRPYTINLSGSLGHSDFNADLEGVCLTIKSAHPLSVNEEQKLEDKLSELFPPPLDGKFRKKDIDKVLNQNNGTITIKV